MPVNHVALVTIEADPNDGPMKIALAKYATDDTGQAITKISGWDGSAWVPGAIGAPFSMIRVNRHNGSSVWIGGPIAVQIPEDETTWGYFAELYEDGLPCGMSTLTLSKRGRVAIAVALEV